MIQIDSDATRFRAVYSPRPFLGFYLLFILAMVVLAARDAARGRIDGAITMLLLGGGIGIAAIVFFIERSEIVLDRAAGTATLRRRSAFRRDERVLPLSRVVAADNDSPFGRDRGTSHRPALVLDDGSRVETRRIYISRRASLRIVAAINDWLGTARAAP